MTKKEKIRDNIINILIPTIFAAVYISVGMYLINTIITPLLFNSWIGILLIMISGILYYNVCKYIVRDSNKSKSNDSNEVKEIPLAEQIHLLDLKNKKNQLLRERKRLDIYNKEHHAKIEKNTTELLMVLTELDDMFNKHKGETFHTAIVDVKNKEG